MRARSPGRSVNWTRRRVRLGSSDAQVVEDVGERGEGAWVSVHRRRPYGRGGDDAAPDEHVLVDRPGDAGLKAESYERQEPVEFGAGSGSVAGRPRVEDRP